LKNDFRSLFRHSRAGGNPGFSGCYWIPVFTGMTNQAASEAFFNKLLKQLLVFSLITVLTFLPCLSFLCAFASLREKKVFIKVSQFLVRNMAIK
jgi:hypothetical protein